LAKTNQAIASPIDVGSITNTAILN